MPEHTPSPYRLDTIRNLTHSTARPRSTTLALPLHLAKLGDPLAHKDLFERMDIPNPLRLIIMVCQTVLFPSALYSMNARTRPPSVPDPILLPPPFSESEHSRRQPV
jgi:hypothetical protein